MLFYILVQLLYDLCQPHTKTVQSSNVLFLYSENISTLQQTLVDTADRLSQNNHLPPLPRIRLFGPEWERKTKQRNVAVYLSTWQLSYIAKCIIQSKPNFELLYHVACPCCGNPMKTYRTIRYCTVLVTFVFTARHMISLYIKNSAAPRNCSSTAENI